MTAYLESAITDIRRLSAAGDFTAARRRLGEFLAANPQLDAAAVRSLSDQRRTLEVLESLEVIRQLLRDGKAGSAARAADGIREALGNDEYSRLGILGAALALLGRAGDLARRAESGDRSRDLHEELGVFLEHLSSELNHLQTEQVDRRLQQVLEPDQAGSSATLGDLLSRRPWRSNLLPAVDAPAAAAASGQAPAAAAAATRADGSPVIGRILISQEQQERVAPVASPLAQPAQADMFNLVGAAAFRYWHVVLGIAVICGAIGWFGVLSAPEKWQSSSLLQKSPQSSPRAPLTARPETYVSSLPSQTVLQLASLPTFHERVAARLTDIGWAEDGKPTSQARLPITREQVAASLTPTVENTGGGFYSIRFTAVTADGASAQAVAGAAADVFQTLHFEHVTREANANLTDYEQRQVTVNAALEKIYQKRLDEFAVESSSAVGVTVKDRIEQLLVELRTARTSRQELQTGLAASRQQEASLREIAERIPPYEELPPDAKLTALRTLKVEMEKELYDLLRKRGDFGPEHPFLRRIRDLQEDLRLADREIEEIERSNAADVDRRRVNPLRANADSRVAEARSATSLLEMRLNVVQESIPRLETELSGLRERYLASEALRREETSLMSQKDRYAVIMEELTAVRDSAGRELTLIAPAAKAQKVPRQELVGIAAGLIAGLVIGIGVAVALLRRRQLAENEAATA
ncbi:MAG: hypothetical protein KF754_13560 [Planctomycetes bacterium]|nr:hypothetical protein [Planctomycetota bacterium]